MPAWGGDSFQEIPLADLLEAWLIRRQQAEPGAADPSDSHVGSMLARAGQPGPMGPCAGGPVGPPQGCKKNPVKTLVITTG